MKTEYLSIIPVAILAILTIWTIYCIVANHIRGHRIGFICKYCGRLINVDGERISGADEVRYDEMACLQCERKEAGVKIDF